MIRRNTDLTREYLQRVIEECKGSTMVAAKRLGVSVDTVQRLARVHGLLDYAARQRVFARFERTVAWR